MSHIPLDLLSERSKAAIGRLIRHEYQMTDLSKLQPGKLAAVLVLLFEVSGQLCVLLTTRSKALRTHAGQTALPGGRKDDTDDDLIQTAFREAHEEVLLPLRCPDIYTLCTLEPFVSLHRLVVTPVIAFLADPRVIDRLAASESEVSCIFSHPLEAILDPELIRGSPLVPLGSEDWPYETELHNTTDSPSILGGTYRMHRFRSIASPVKGLTSDILIKVAEIAFGRSTAYERYAPSQVHGFSAIYPLLLEEQG